jgi:hypothetical protein
MNIIHVKYKNKIIGYTIDNGKTIQFNDSVEAKEILESKDKTHFISSRSIGRTQIDKTVIENHIIEICLTDLKND